MPSLALGISAYSNSCLHENYILAKKTDNKQIKKENK